MRDRYDDIKAKIVAITSNRGLSGRTEEHLLWIVREALNRAEPIADDRLLSKLQEIGNELRSDH
jgi:hypothetical protein